MRASRPPPGLPSSSTPLTPRRHVYYLPFYFQAVKGTSAEGSGLRCIPYLVSLTLSSLITGALITYVGHYVPILWVGSAIFVVGSALLHTLDVDTPTAYWVGAELLAGVGVGACVQTPFVAVQVVLDEKDMVRLLSREPPPTC